MYKLPGLSVTKSKLWALSFSFLRTFASLKALRLLQQPEITWSVASDAGKSLCGKIIYKLGSHSYKGKLRFVLWVKSSRRRCSTHSNDRFS